MNCISTVTFLNGELVKQVERIKYLGVIIDEKASREYEIELRLSNARDTAIKLRKFWRRAAVPKIWKLQIFNAMVISQLIYALESLHLTETCFKKLDAFHMRGLRYVFDIKPAYVSRVSNEELLEIANDTLEKENINDHPMDLFTEELLKRSSYKPEEF